MYLSSSLFAWMITISGWQFEVESAGDLIGDRLEIRNDRYLLVFALAASTRLSMPSVSPLAIQLSSQRKTPSQWRLTVAATAIIDWRRLRAARKYQCLSPPVFRAGVGCSYSFWNASFIWYARQVFR